MRIFNHVFIAYTGFFAKINDKYCKNAELPDPKQDKGVIELALRFPIITLLTLA